MVPPLTCPGCIIYCPRVVFFLLFNSIYFSVLFIYGFSPLCFGYLPISVNNQFASLNCYSISNITILLCMFMVSLLHVISSTPYMGFPPDIFLSDFFFPVFYEFSRLKFFFFFFLAVNFTFPYFRIFSYYFQIWFSLLSNFQLNACLCAYTVIFLLQSFLWQYFPCLAEHFAFREDDFYQSEILYLLYFLYSVYSYFFLSSSYTVSCLNHYQIFLWQLPVSPKRLFNTRMLRLGSM